MKKKKPNTPKPSSKSSKHKPTPIPPPTDIEPQSPPLTTITKTKSYSTSIIDSLKSIYSLITSHSFDTKPSYLNITSSPHINSTHLPLFTHLSSITPFILVTPIELLYKEQYEQHNKISLEKDKCSICQYTFYDEAELSQDKPNDSEFIRLTNMELDVVLLSKCSDHFFHIECLSLLISSKNNFRCPNCSCIYGVFIGDMPYGTMTAYHSKRVHCSGYKSCGTIVINYYFPNGKTYTGTSRECYLPFNAEGIELLALLKIAFDRKLTFTVGTSVTTGVSNTTVWNGIHHKTNLSGGATRFGYPDATYFTRVKEELAAKGVNVNDFNKNELKSIGMKLLGE